MQLPEVLVTQIRQGRVILLLGAGASLDATDIHGQSAPTSLELAKLLANKFLSEAHIDHDLMTISELAISETSLPEVQDYIASLLADLEPSAAHKWLPTFRWHGLATTNYDRLVELAYESDQQRSQKLAAVISDTDSMDEVLRSENRLALLKLHGCLSRTRDYEVPFILTTEQYITHRRHRDNLFRTLKEWGSDRPLVAVGHSLRDPDLRRILLELDELGSARPRYYLVGPEFTVEEERWWESRRITPIRGSFNEFLTTLDERIPSPLRRAYTKDHDEHPIERRLSRPLLEETVEYLMSDAAQFVYGGMNVDSVAPTDFYRGLSPDWAAIEQNLDVRRSLTDTVLYDVILADEAYRHCPVEFYVILAEAGAGKSVCLQRIAWEAAIEANRLCIFVRPDGYLNYDAVADVARTAGQRLFLFVDNVAENVSSIHHLLQQSRRDGLLITVISTERQNQWNIYCERLETQLTEHYNLRYLNHSEIVGLIDLLRKHKSLGYLEKFSEADRVSEFESRTGRQLLVALLEATYGKPHQEILVDEFNRIVPERARSLYLTVCMLSRLGIPVRAGLISRVHGIPLKDFRDHLFKPLEHVVRVREDKVLRDYVYLARHSLIAEIVFDRILGTRERRFDEYLRLFKYLNLSYRTDMTAFRKMIRGRLMLELFPDYEDARAIFDSALKLAPDDTHVLHQRGIYEMNRANGNLESAHNFLVSASSIAPIDSTIMHSLAELERKRGELATNEIQRKRHRDEAVRLAKVLQSDPVQGSYGYHTILKTHLDRLREILGSSGNDDIEIDRVLQEVEETITAALQRFPGDEYILASEAEFAEILDDEERARLALSRAFDRNKRSPYIASRLARVLEKSNRVDEAVRVLETAVEANSSNRELNFALALMLRQADQDDPDTMLHHLRRSFVPGDRNYTAQFWYSCYLYMKDSIDTARESRKIFRYLWTAPLPFKARASVRAYFTTSDGTNASFTGVLSRREETYGWIDRDGAGDSVMVHTRNLEPHVWASLRERARVRFEIGFCFGGPVGVNLQDVEA